MLISPWSCKAFFFFFFKMIKTKNVRILCKHKSWNWKNDKKEFCFHGSELCPWSKAPHKFINPTRVFICFLFGYDECVCLLLVIHECICLVIVSYQCTCLLFISHGCISVFSWSVISGVPVSSGSLVRMCVCVQLDVSVWLYHKNCTIVYLFTCLFFSQIHAGEVQGIIKDLSEHMNKTSQWCGLGLQLSAVWKEVTG